MARTLDRTTLENLLLGKLPPEEAEPLLSQLEDKAALARLAAQLADSPDTLVESLRAQATLVETPPDPRIAALIDRLARMVEEGSQSRTAPAPEGTQFVPSKANSLPFLAASQQTDEMGRLGGYRILRVLGQGGMGMVLLAEDPKLKRQVAIKVMKPEFAANEQAKERFLREARTTAQIEHDHVIAVHQVGEEGGVPFLVMPLLKGETLDDRLRREPRPPLPETLRIGREIAEGLAAAHERGLIHRDIKPGNVWLEVGRGRVKVLDFGLARTGEADQKLTQSGAVVGTPSYMAPEQAGGERVDARCDLFSLGCILYQMTVGQKPFVGSSIMNILFSLANHQPAPPIALNASVPPELSDLVMRLLSKRPDGRPRSARHVADELAAIEERLKHPTAIPVAHPVDDTAVADPWAGIDDETEVAPASGEASAPRVRAGPEAGGRLGGLTPPRSPRMLRGVLVGTGLLAALIVVLFAAGVIRIETPKGTLVIEGADDDVEVVIKQGGAVIKDKVKAREIELKVGDYQIDLAERKDGLRLETNQFTITRDGKTPIRVYVERAVVKKNPPVVKGRDPGTVEPKQPIEPVPAESLAFFNGKDLAGWEGKPEYWSVRNGALVGSTRPGGLQGFNTCLCSKKSYKDFELSFRVRLQGQNANSGVQIRSSLIEKPKYIVSGPQADMGGEFWGSLYGERFGGMMRQAPADAVTKAAVKENDFNDYFIRCVGKRVTIKLNGITTVDEEFEKLPDEGIIGWQLHGGPPMEAEFRDIRFRDLSVAPPSPADVGWVQLFNGRDLTGWAIKNGGSGNWKVVEGAITCTGPQDYLYTDRDDFGDFHLRAEVKVNEKGNSGIYFRAAKPVALIGDYEAQISTRADQQKTGSLYALGVVKEVLVQPDTWFTYEVIAQGDRIRLLVNGKETANYQETRPGRRARGYIALQHHDAITTVAFRKIEVKEPAAEQGFVPLFNSKDLTGWKTHPDQPGHWPVENGILVGKSEPVSHLFSERGDYGDFHLRAEVRVIAGGNGGIFIRSPFGVDRNGRYPFGYEAQLLNEPPKQPPPNFTGTLIVHTRENPTLVADMKSADPIARAGEWFTYEVIARGKRFILKVNGQTTTDFEEPNVGIAKGHIALQMMGQNSVVEYRKIEVKELTAEQGFVPLFNGKDLTGWQDAAAQAPFWKVEGDVLHYVGMGGKNLVTTKNYRDFELYVDWKIAKGGDSGICLRGQPQVQIWEESHPPSRRADGRFIGSGGLWNNPPGQGKDPLVAADQPTGEWNTFYIKMVGGKVTVKLNDKLVVDNEFMLPGKLPPEGPIELQMHTGPVWFRNVRVRELP